MPGSPDGDWPVAEPLLARLPEGRHLRRGSHVLSDPPSSKAFPAASVGLRLFGLMLLMSSDEAGVWPRCPCPAGDCPGWPDRFGDGEPVAGDSEINFGVRLIGSSGVANSLRPGEFAPPFRGPVWPSRWSSLAGGRGDSPLLEFSCSLPKRPGAPCFSSPVNGPVWFPGFSAIDGLSGPSFPR